MSDEEADQSVEVRELSEAATSQRDDAAIALLKALKQAARSAEHAGSGPSTVEYAAASRDLADAFARIYGR